MDIISLREELINYFCHLLPKSVSITFDEKEIDQIIKDHLQQQVSVKPEVEMNFADVKKDFEERFFTEIEFPNHHKIPVTFTAERRAELWQWIEKTFNSKISA